VSDNVRLIQIRSNLFYEKVLVEMLVEFYLFTRIAVSVGGL